VNGLVYQNQSVVGYYDQIGNLQQHVAAAFSQLQHDYELVIAEGAGSPVELNLLEKDLSNTFVAKTFQTCNILVADIERGGVFASIYGTMQLLDPELRANLIGVIINKFRGDARFFIEGERIIREQFGLPVLGVLPFTPFNIDLEDSQSLQNYKQRRGAVKIRLAVFAYPGISNYNDLDVLMADPEIDVEWVDDYRPLQHFDVLLLPGSKTVIRDLHWLKNNALFVEIQHFNKPIFGICGGYQMLCAQLHDPEGLEHDFATTEQGLGLIADEVTYQQPKIVQRGEYTLFSFSKLQGYEIHCGRLAKYPLYYEGENVAGTHLHGVFDNNAFRTAYFQRLNPTYVGYDYQRYRDAEIQGFADMAVQHLDIQAILQAVQDSTE
jgi:adenosylcobyric acid synthase